VKSSPTSIFAAGLFLPLLLVVLVSSPLVESHQPGHPLDDITTTTAVPVPVPPTTSESPNQCGPNEERRCPNCEVDCDHVRGFIKYGDPYACNRTCTWSETSCQCRSGFLRLMVAGGGCVAYDERTEECIPELPQTTSATATEKPSSTAPPNPCPCPRGEHLEKKPGYQPTCSTTCPSCPVCRPEIVYSGRGICVCDSGLYHNPEGYCVEKSQCFPAETSSKGPE